MSDLLDLDYSKCDEFHLTGIDLDHESLERAEQSAALKGKKGNCSFVCEDAWHLSFKNAFDLLTSNGLNIYEADEIRAVALYTQFFKALKPRGALVISFLTPPPIPGFITEWGLQNVNKEHALFQKIVFADILASKWQTYRSEALMRSQLQEAGFEEIEVVYDNAHIFPTVIAKKPS